MMDLDRSEIGIRHSKTHFYDEKDVAYASQRLNSSRLSNTDRV
jgi:hypothetical protein